MTLRQFIKRLESYNEELMDKEVKVIAQNGLIFEAEAKLVLKSEYDVLNYHAENIECIIITW